MFHKHTHWAAIECQSLHIRGSGFPTLVGAGASYCEPCLLCCPSFARNSGCMETLDPSDLYYHDLCTDGRRPFFCMIDVAAIVADSCCLPSGFDGACQCNVSVAFTLLSMSLFVFLSHTHKHTHSQAHRRHAKGLQYSNALSPATQGSHTRAAARTLSKPQRNITQVPLQPVNTPRTLRTALPATTPRVQTALCVSTPPCHDPAKNYAPDINCNQAQCVQANTATVRWIVFDHMQFSPTTRDPFNGFSSGSYAHMPRTLAKVFLCRSRVHCVRIRQIHASSVVRRSKRKMGCSNTIHLVSIACLEAGSSLNQCRPLSTVLFDMLHSTRLSTLAVAPR